MKELSIVVRYDVRVPDDFTDADVRDVLAFHANLGHLIAGQDVDPSAVDIGGITVVRGLAAPGSEGRPVPTYVSDTRVRPAQRQVHLINATIRGQYAAACGMQFSTDASITATGPSTLGRGPICPDCLAARPEAFPYDRPDRDSESEEVPA